MFAFGIVFVNRSQAPGQVRVVVADRDNDSREPITADMITLSPVPVNALPPKAYLKLSDLTGYSALVTIPRGQALTANIVASNPDQLAAGVASSFLPIPQGYVALTLPTGEQQGVAGYIAPGDAINVIATLNTVIFSPASPRMATRTVFTTGYVIPVGPPSAAPEHGQRQGVPSSRTGAGALCV